MKYPLIPKLAKWLNHGGKWYRFLLHKDGTEWCVLVALDQGRCMEIVKAGTDGKVHKRIYARHYKDYSIDLASLSDEGEAAVLEHFERT